LHSSWKSPDLDARILPLFQEHDEAKRMAGYKAVDAYIAENAYVIPLFQFYQPVVYKRGLRFKPHLAGHILPFRMGRA
jgi:peptide/nickel transport system substrate-binding protein